METIENTQMVLIKTITYGDLAIIGAIIIVGVLIMAVVATKSSK